MNWDNIFNTKLDENQKSSGYKINIPEIKPLPLFAGGLVFASIVTVGISIGATIGTYVFFGCVTLAGLIALAESNKYVRFAIIKGNKLVDIIIFGATIYASASLGITMAASLTVAGLGYTLVYAPWIRKRFNNNKK